MVLPNQECACPEKLNEFEDCEGLGARMHHARRPTNLQVGLLASGIHV